MSLPSYSYVLIACFAIAMLVAMLLFVCILSKKGKNQRVRCKSSHFSDLPRTKSVRLSEVSPEYPESGRATDSSIPSLDLLDLSAETDTNGVLQLRVKGFSNSSFSEIQVESSLYAELESTVGTHNYQLWRYPISYSTKITTLARQKCPNLFVG
jgi:hypothetical protein